MNNQKFIIKFDKSKVQFSKNDHKLKIIIPDILTQQLAHLIGIQVGDGYMKIKERKSAVDYCMSYDGHSINEFDWYVEYLSPL